MKRALFALGFFGIAIGCSASPSGEDTGSTKQAIIGGRPSGDDENAAVFIKTEDAAAGLLLRCSGRIIAPGLVLSARHCFLKRKAENVRCTPDGAPLEISDTVTAEVVAPEKITVYVGSDKASQRAVAVKQTFTNFDVGLCRSDIGFLVLAEAGLDTRTPIRRELPKNGETVSVTGWGYVDDTQREKLPDTRATVDTSIFLTGPGVIPAGTFAVPGNTLCLGDSGANSLIDGAAVGVYTRIDGDADNCTNPLVRNVLTAVMSEPDVLAKAYAAIGEEPWFAGEERPWLAAAGMACTKDDDCRSGVCDGSSCRAGCGPTKLACKVGQDCVADACVASTAPPPAPADAGPAAASPKDDSSCTAAPRSRGGVHGAFLLLVTVAAFACWRRRGTTTST